MNKNLVLLVTIFLITLFTLSSTSPKHIYGESNESNSNEYRFIEIDSVIRGLKCAKTDLRDWEIDFVRRDSEITLKSKSDCFIKYEDDLIILKLWIVDCKRIARTIDSKQSCDRSFAKYDDEGRLVIFDSISGNDCKKIIQFYYGIENLEDPAILPVYLRSHVW